MILLLIFRSAIENVTTGKITCNGQVDPFAECAMRNCILYESRALCKNIFVQVIHPMIQYFKIYLSLSFSVIVSVMMD